MTIRLCLFAFCLGFALAIPFARADEPPPDVKAEAQKLSQEGTEAYGAGRYGQALARFEAAFRTFPAPELALNLSRTEHKLRHCDKAIAYARTYAGAFGQLPAKSTDSAATWLATVSADCPEVEITSEPPGASFRFKGTRTVLDTPWKGRLPVGTYSLLARLAGRATSTREARGHHGTAGETAAVVPGGRSRVANP